MLADRPEPAAEWLPVWDAFHLLNDFRRWAFVYGAKYPLAEPLQFHDVIDAADRFGAPAGIAVHDFVALIGAMDKAYREHMNART